MFMGVDLHGLRFLRYLHRNGDFENTVTIGRQALVLKEDELATELNARIEDIKGEYCEKLLRNCFGATSVDSVDYSDFEKATLILDMNKDLPEAHANQYNTVIDFGCLEHIYRVTTALENCSKLCKPELFFSLYSSENGYSETEVFLADLRDVNHWFAVTRPSEGRRVDIITKNETYVLVRTVLGQSSYTHTNVQQSDYVYLWTPQDSSNKKRRSLSDRLVQSPLRKIKRKLGLSMDNLHHNSWLKMKNPISEEPVAPAELTTSNMNQFPDISIAYDAIISQGKIPLIIDAGSNIGASVVYFSKCFPEAHIIGIEPQ
eukprot:gene18822-19135_t